MLYIQKSCVQKFFGAALPEKLTFPGFHYLNRGIAGTLADDQSFDDFAVDATFEKAHRFGSPNVV
uniref:Uncharacterized protein n=1 Tax=Romanomermis culicivorax TaxID=13658 RepID=A0A915KWQ0_ROMCU